MPGNGTGRTSEVERAKWIAAARGLRVNRGRPPEEIKAVVDFLFSDDSPAWLRESVTGLPTLASAKSTDFYARLHASYLESGKTGKSNSRLRHAQMRHRVNKPEKYVSPAVE